VAFAEAVWLVVWDPRFWAWTGKPDTVQPRRSAKHASGKRIFNVSGMICNHSHPIPNLGES